MSSLSTIAPHSADATARAESPTSSPHGYDVGLLVLRLALGLTMAAHGSQKLFGWFEGPGLEGTGMFFESLGYPSGETMALIAGVSETFGGLALVIGLFTPLAAAAVFGTMLNAIVAVHWDGGFFSPDGVEFALILAAGAVALALTGPGRFAVDRMLPVLRTHRLSYGAAAVLLGAVVAGLTLLIRN